MIRVSRFVRVNNTTTVRMTLRPRGLGCVPNVRRSSLICSPVRFFFRAPEEKTDTDTFLLPFIAPPVECQVLSAVGKYCAGIPTNTSVRRALLQTHLACAVGVQTYTAAYTTPQIPQRKTRFTGILGNGGSETQAETCCL